MRPAIGYPVILALIVLVFFGPHNTARAGDPTPDNPWSAILLPTPAEAATRQYLGLPVGKHFFVGQIVAEVVIVEVYSMYCPFCQQEAPRVNELYDLIAGQPDLHRRVKMIGVGTGNSQYEVDFYRESYGVKFPLFPDGKFIIHKQLGETRTPHFFVLKPAGNKAVKIVYDEVGGFASPGAFLEMVQKHLANE